MPHNLLRVGSKFIGHCLVIASITYLALQYASGSDNHFSNLDLPGPKTTSLAILLFLLTNTFSVVAWQHINNGIQKSKISFFTAFKIWMQSNIGKYLPGNIFQYVGRLTLSHQAGIKSGPAILGIISEVLLLVVAAILLAAPLYLSGNISFTTIFPRPPPFPHSYLLVGIAIATLGLFIYLISKRNVLLASANPYRFTEVKSNIKLVLSISTIPLIFYSLSFATSGLAAQLIITNCWQSSSTIATPILISAYAVSFMIGFIMPGAPGGLGVREFALVSALTPFIGFADSLSLAIALRGCSLIADFLGATISLLIPKKLEPAVLDLK